MKSGAPLEEKRTPIFNVDESPKRTAECGTVEEQRARVAKFGYHPGESKPALKNGGVLNERSA